MNTYYLISDSGVEPVVGNITITARQAVSRGHLVVNQDGKPVEPPLKTTDSWYGRFDS